MWLSLASSVMFPQLALDLSFQSPNQLSLWRPFLWVLQVYFLQTQLFIFWVQMLDHRFTPKFHHMLYSTRCLCPIQAWFVLKVRTQVSQNHSECIFQVASHFNLINSLPLKTHFWSLCIKQTYYQIIRQQFA